jgi:hypothetical protein
MHPELGCRPANPENDAPEMSTAPTFALVTGASSGIGFHITGELARRGYSIIAVSNQPDKLTELKKETEGRWSVPVHIINTDLALPGAAQTVFDHCMALGFEVEVLVNNAGMLVAGEAVETDPAPAEQILQLHVSTPALLCRFFGERMAARKRGFILNVSSISAVMPYPVISFYGPSKAFLRSFTRALRTEMQWYGVGVTCLLPGATATALYDPYQINIPLAMRLGVMKKPEIIARAGVKALFTGRAECIPGLLNKLLVWFLPLVPHFLIAGIYRVKKKQRRAMA